jgi:hypothetical protein
MDHPTARGRFLCLLATLVAVVVLAAACGGDDADSESFDRPDSTSGDDATDATDEPDDSGDVGGACDLLSTDDVEALLGQAVEDGVEEEIGEDATECTFSTEEDSVAVGEPITLQIELGPLTDEISDQIDEALASDSNQPLDLGDRSVLVCGLGADGTSCDAYDDVAVAVDDVYLEVDLGNWGYPDDFDEDEGVQITVDAAEQAVDGLG